MKFYFKIFSIIALLAGVYFACIQLGFFNNPLDSFKKKELSLEPTELILSEIKSISQLFTTTYYSEFLLEEKRDKEAFFGLTKSQESIAIVAKGTCYIGIDLSKITENDILIESNNCTINLPTSSILDVVMNPSDFKIFDEEGTWTQEEITHLKSIAQEKLKEKAFQSDVMQKSNERTIKLFHDLLTSLGYSKININVK